MRRYRRSPAHNVRVEPPQYDWTAEPLPEPWFVLPSDLRADFESELHKEVREGHVLWRRRTVAVAKCEHCDAVAFSVEGSYVQWALVHLTWTRRLERMPWPGTSLHATLAEAVAAHITE